MIKDEGKRAMSRMTFADNGTLIEDHALNLRLRHGFGHKMNDLAGLGLDDRDSSGPARR